MSMLFEVALSSVGGPVKETTSNVEAENWGSLQWQDPYCYSVF